MSGSKLFLKRFPEADEIMRINKLRIKGFLDFAIEHKDNDKISCIKPNAARMIATINNLGFITLDSQEGCFKKTKHPINIYNEDEPYVNSDDSPAVLKIYSERAYCEGIIRNELLTDFVKHLKNNNSSIDIIEYPYDGPSINLTATCFRYKDLTEKVDFHTNINSIDKFSTDNQIIDALEDNGYYLGPDLEYVPIDSDWVNIIIYDTRYRHHAMKKTDGLFNCIQRALKYVLTEA